MSDGITTTGLAYDIQSIDAGAAAQSHGVTSYKPKNGQHIVFHATATNVSLGSASMSSASTSPTDASGKTYTAAPFEGAAGPRGRDSTRSSYPVRPRRAGSLSTYRNR